MDQDSAQVNSDVYPHHGQYAVNVDFQRSEFRVRWSGNWTRPPSLAQFPSSALESADATVEPISHSLAMDEIWSCSQAIIHGANAHIRLLDDSTDSFPICKIAIDKRQ